MALVCDKIFSEWERSDYMQWSPMIKHKKEKLELCYKEEI